MSHTLMTLIFPDDRVETIWRDNSKGTCQTLARFSHKEITDMFLTLQTLSGVYENITPDMIRLWCNQSVINSGILAALADPEDGYRADTKFSRSKIDGNAKVHAAGRF